VAQPAIRAQLAEYQESTDSKFNTDTSSYPVLDHEFDQFVNEDIPSPYENEAMDDIPELDDIVKDDITLGEDTYDGLIGAEIHMPGHDGSFTKGKVIKRVKVNDGKAISRHHTNPLMDTSEYKVELEDGSSA